MDPDMRRLALFAGGIGTVLVLLITASAITHRNSGEAPVITADARPIRVKPENPGGMKINGAENDVFSAGTDTVNAKLAPAAETPDTKAWRSAPAPVSEAPSPAAAVTAPVQQAVVAAPKAMPAAVKPALAAAAVPAKPALAAAAVPAKPAAPPAASGHSASVQLAAVSSEEAARGEWQTLSKRMPELLGSRQPSYSRTERDGHTYWRVRTTGFADGAQARGFCEKVRAKGAGCSVTEF